MKMRVSRIETEIVAFIGENGGIYLRDSESTTGFCCYISPEGLVTPNHTELKLTEENLGFEPVYRGDEIRIKFT